MSARFPAVWGAAEHEVLADYPCDAFARDPDVTLWRAVDVDAPPALVFRWLQQLRLAPYSYDLIDNRGRRSPRVLTPSAETLAVGQLVLGVFRLVAFEPGRTLTFGPGSRRGVELFGAVHGTYAVTPRGSGARIIAKLCCSVGDTWYAGLYARALPLLDLIMMRKQLLTLAALAERDARAAVRKR